MTQTKTYKCPACDAPLRFDGKEEKLLCEYCGAEIEAAAFAEEDAPEEGARGWEKYGQGKADWSEGAATLLSCPSCGGEIVCEAETASTVCPYCDNPALIAGQLSGAYRPDVILPFTVDKKDAGAALDRFCKRKWLLPKGFRKESKTESLKGIYVPYFLFDCDTNSRFTYSAIRKTSWRSGDYRYTRTSYYRLIRRGLLDFANIPVDASVKTDNTLLESIEPFDFTAAVPYSDAHLAGLLANRYDDSPENCSVRAAERVATSIDAALRRTIVGYLSVQKRSEDILYTKSDVRYALLPVWFMTRRYKDKSYTFVVNGQSGKMSGSLPVSWGRFFGFLSAFTALGTALISLIALLV
ncbi:MAG: hypothetical protein IJV96_00070 [Clostridia bacterium]|nr:hypothetical protein [Clostridia bacterium]